MSESDGFDSEDLADEEVLEQIAQLEGNDEGNGIEADCRGLLYAKKKKKGLKKGKKWKVYQFYLVGSSMWYYRSGEENPKASIELKGKFELGDAELTQAESRNNLFSIKKSDLSTVWIFSATAPAEKEKWIEAIRKGVGADAAKPPQGAVRRKSSLILRAKKKMAGKAATSGVGKRLIRSVVNDDQIDVLIDSGKALVARDTSEKNAQLVEDNVVKLAVKGIILFRNGSIKAEEGAPLEPLLRKLSKALKETFNCFIKYKRKPDELKIEAEKHFDALAELVGTLRKHLIELFNPFVTDNTITKIKDITDYFGDKETWRRLYSKEEREDFTDLKSFVKTVNFYETFF